MLFNMKILLSQEKLLLLLQTQKPNLINRLQLWSLLEGARFHPEAAGCAARSVMTRSNHPRGFNLRSGFSLKILLSAVVLLLVAIEIRALRYHPQGPCVSFPILPYNARLSKQPGVGLQPPENHLPWQVAQLAPWL
jgi:hypothetical protein